MVAGWDLVSVGGLRRPGHRQVGGSTDTGTDKLGGRTDTFAGPLQACRGGLSLRESR